MKNNILDGDLWIKCHSNLDEHINNSMRNWNIDSESLLIRHNSSLHELLNEIYLLEI